MNNTQGNINSDIVDQDLIKDILEESSYLFYEFRDKEVSYKDPSGSYKKKISPLFVKDVINKKENWNLLSIITEELPFYYLESSLDISDKKEGPTSYLSNSLLSNTRDIGINNVPSTLQTDFYEVWFRETQGFIQNTLLLDIYNKLRWPFINENQYLTAKKFPELSRKLENSKDSEIEFKDTVDDNNQDLKDGERGCLDYLEETINSKIQSMYDIVDYNAGQTSILKSWASSNYYSGILSKDRLEYEKTVFRLQDIKHELLRRKFAGSSTLYNLALASINRQGSFVSTTPVYAVTGTRSIDYDFKDNRTVRVLDLPGITTAYAKLSDIDPFKLFYVRKLEKREELPLGLLVPLFYSSANYEIRESGKSEEIKYDPERFYEDLYNTLTTPEGDNTYKHDFLRENNRIINWESITSVISSSSITDTYKTFDELRAGQESDWYTLDNYTKVDGILREDVIHLDTSTPLISRSSITGSTLDMTANHLLYHKNSLQGAPTNLSSSYEYLTYPIAEGNSVSLMDSTWLDYLKLSTENKSRVQDEITLGSQISFYGQIQAQGSGVTSLFAISYGSQEDVDNPFSTYTPVGYTEYINLNRGKEPSIAYLWYITLKYSASSYEIDLQRSEITLISKIFLKDLSIEGLKKESRGILPVTYDISSENVFNFQKISDLEDQELTDVSFVFSDRDLIRIPVGSFVGTSPIEAVEKNDFLFDKPTKNTKCVYFILKRDQGDFKTNSWSEPLRVLDFTSTIYNDIKEGFTLKPDWFSLGYYLNPYLNFTKDSASPLRHKKNNILAYGVEESAEEDAKLEGPSTLAGLCNLTRVRGYQDLCNDKGEREFPEETTKVIGFYLERYHLFNTDGSRVLNSDVEIYGDNRYQDALSSENDIRTDIHYDFLGVPCIQTHPTSGRPSKTALKVNNFLKIQPAEDSKDESGEYTLEELDERLWRNWWWNINNDTALNSLVEPVDVEGITICLNVLQDVEFDKEKTTYKSILIKREHEFEICLEKKEEDDYYISFTSIINGSIPVETTLKLESQEIKTNLRITANVSLIQKKINLLVNNRRASTSIEVESPKIDKSLAERESIYLLSNVHLRDEDDPERAPGYYYVQENNFYGCLYDVRLYNEDFSETQLSLLNLGTMRELYSYEPSNYRLANSIYRDFGTFKEVARDFREPTVTDIRVFNRSVWDSIYVDNYPISAGEKNIESFRYRTDFKDPRDDSDIYDKKGNITDCIQQNLLDTVEVVNTSNPLEKSEKGACAVRYKDQVFDIGRKDWVNIVTTTLYPVQYKDYPYQNFKTIFEGEYSPSEKRYIVHTTNENPIRLPDITPVDEVIKYSADLDFNFSLDTVSDFTRWYSRGINIALKYSNDLQKTIVQKELQGADSSNNNHILIPLVIPKQEITSEVDSLNYTYLDRFYFKDVQLHPVFNTLLKATSYYNELRIPIVKDFGENRTGFVSKWDALRVLKEGTYYITCKYPIQIQPLKDEDFNSDTRNTYSFFYLTSLFKVQVTGEPVVYSEEDYKIDGIPEKYTKSRIIKTLSDEGQLYNPKDNRSFPHRKIKIDLFALDVDSSQIAGKMNPQNEEEYEYRWKLLASNHVLAEEDSLNGEILKKDLYIREEIPAFLQKNYLLPFFLAKYRRTSDVFEYDPLSADDDLIDPIRVRTFYNDDALSKENIQVLSEKDLDRQVLVAGRSYKMLFDYRGYISEFSFKDTIDSNVSDNTELKYFTLGNSEKVDFTRLTSLKDTTVDEEEYFYKTDGQSYNPSSILEKTSGFEVIGKKLERLELPSKKESSFDFYYQPVHEDEIKGFIYNLTEENYTEVPVRFVSNTSELLPEADKYFILREKGLETEYSKAFRYPGSYKGYPLYTISKEVDEENKKVQIVNLDGTTTEKVFEENDVYQVQDSSRYFRVISSEGVLTLEFLKNYLVKSYTNFEELETETTVVQIGEKDYLYVQDKYTTTPRPSTSRYYIWTEEPNKYYEVSLNTYKPIQGLGNILYIKDRIYRNREDEEIQISVRTELEGLPATEDEKSLYCYEKHTSDNKLERSYYQFKGSEDAHFSEKSTNLSETVIYFGNPYSRSSNKNYLIENLKSDLNSRHDIDNSYTFPYVATERGSFNIPATPLQNIDVYKSVGDYTRETIRFNEIEILESLFNSIKSKISKNFINLQNSTTGIFTQLSTIRPYIHNTLSSSQKGSFVETQVMYAELEDLITYTADPRITSDRNRSLGITRKGVYSNNLLRIQDFTNSNFWTLRTRKNSIFNSTNYDLYYTPDDEWQKGVGKDVFKISYTGSSNEDDPLYIEYQSGSVEINSTWETALSLKVLSGTTPRVFISPIKKTNTTSIDVLENLPELKVTPGEGKRDILSGYSSEDKKHFFKDEKHLFEYTPETNKIYKDILEDQYYEYNITSRIFTEVSVDYSKWQVFTIEITKPVVCSSVAFVLQFAGPSEIEITKAVLRRAEIKNHLLGLSNVLRGTNSLNGEDTITVLSHDILSFRNRASNELTPLQMRNKIITTNSIVRATSSLYGLRNFIRRYSLSRKDAKIQELIKPWVRRLVFEQDYSNPELKKVINFYKYEVFENSSGLRQKKESYSVEDIFSRNLIDCTYNSDTGNIEINDLGLISEADVLRATFGTNLQIVQVSKQETSEENKISLVHLTNERFTALTNSFQPDAYKNEDTSLVAVTNIQLLGKAEALLGSEREILYELEYLPLVYDEKKYHLSVNIFVDKQNPLDE